MDCFVIFSVDMALFPYPPMHPSLQMTRRISRTLEATRFSGAVVVPVAAKPGGPEAPSAQSAIGVDSLIQVNCGFNCTY